MSIIVNILWTLTICRTVASSKNVCDKDCISNIMFSRSNWSSKSSDHITINNSILEQSIKLNQVISDNETSDSDNFCHFVPKVTKYERGANAAVKIVDDFIKCLLT